MLVASTVQIQEPTRGELEGLGIEKSAVLGD